MSIDNLNKKKNLDNQINVKLLTTEKKELQAYCVKMATTQSQVVRRIIQSLIRGKISLEL